MWRASYVSNITGAGVTAWYITTLGVYPTIGSMTLVYVSTLCTDCFKAVLTVTLALDALTVVHAVKVGEALYAHVVLLIRDDYYIY